MIALHNRFGHHICMGTYWRNEDDRPESLSVRGLRRDRDCRIRLRRGRYEHYEHCVRLLRDDLVDSPLEGSDYFDVIMRVGRPMGRATQFRRMG